MMCHYSVKCISQSFRLSRCLIVKAFLLLSLLICRASSDVDIANPPANVTIRSNEALHLPCDPRNAYSGSFQWRFYSGAAGDFGNQIYYQPPTFQLAGEFPADRYKQFGEYGLAISPVTTLEGGVYKCSFLQGDTHSVATVVVIDAPVSSVTPDIVSLGEMVTLRCSVGFGAPPNDSQAITPTQWPQLDLYVNGQLAADSRFSYHPGQAAVRAHRMTRTLEYRVEQGQTLLSCTVRTQKPAFTATSEAVAYAEEPVSHVTIQPISSQYNLNDVITCSANGYPLPNIQWMRLDSEDEQNTSEVVSGANLTANEEMLERELNVWRCSAWNDLNMVEGGSEVTKEISFTVIEAEEVSDDSPSRGAVIGLGIVITLAALILIVGLIIIIVILVRRRRSQSKPPPMMSDTSPTQAFIYKPAAPEDPELAETRLKQPPETKAKVKPVGKNPDAAPVVKPKPKSRPLLASNSSFQDRSFDSDIKPHPAERSFDRSTEESKPVPMRRPKNTIRGSVESLDKSIDEDRKPLTENSTKERKKPTPKQRPTRGSTESLDDVTKITAPTEVSSVQRPQLRTRASLDRSLDEGSKVSETDEVKEKHSKKRTKPNKRIDTDV